MKQLIFYLWVTRVVEICTLSLHDALPIFSRVGRPPHGVAPRRMARAPALRLDRAGLVGALAQSREERKSTRLDSSHTVESHAIFCLKKKNKCSLLLE